MTDSFALVRTAALRDFKSATGQNNHFIVTILVALRQVELKDITPEAEFSSQWSPRDRKASARRSREYALQTSLTWIVDLLNSLRSNLLETPTAFSDAEVDRIQSPDSARDKLYRLLDVLEVTPTSDFHMCELAITWRNRLVHSSASERSISGSLRRNLLGFEDQIRSKHRGLEVSECVSAYGAGEAPTFKTVASFVQAAQDLARELDRAAVARVSADTFVEVSIRDWANAMAGTHAMTKTWGGPPDQTRRRIGQLLITLGMRGVEATHPQALSADYLDGLISLSPADARARFLPAEPGG